MARKTKYQNLGDRECVLCGWTVSANSNQQEFYPVKDNVEGGCMHVHRNCLYHLRIETVSYNMFDTLGTWTEGGKGKWEPLKNNWCVFIQDADITQERMTAFAEKAKWPEWLDRVIFARGCVNEFAYDVKKGVVCEV